MKNILYIVSLQICVFLGGFASFVSPFQVYLEADEEFSSSRFMQAQDPEKESAIQIPKVDSDPNCCEQCNRMFCRVYQNENGNIVCDCSGPPLPIDGQ